VAIISSGLDVLAGRVADALGIELHYSNKLKTDKAGLLTGEVEVIVPAQRAGEHLPNGKGKILTDIQDKTVINPDDTVAIGDSDSDIPMFIRAGESYAINHATEGAKSAANFYVEDLFALRALLENSPILDSGLEEEEYPENSDC
jgi:phosphoserine phosphatase